MIHLWNDLDENGQLPTNTGRGRTRRLAEPAVLELLRSWLLHEYIADYSRSLAATRIFRRCYLIDGLGMPSRDRKTSSATVHPVLQPVSDLAQTLAQESKPIALYGLLLAHGSSRRRDTRQERAKEPGLPKESGIVNASWLEAAPYIIEAIEQSPAVLLLNPFGHTLFTNDDLTTLYKRTAPTELCFLLPHKQVETLFLTALRSPAYAIVLTAVLRTDRWKTFATEDALLKKSVSDIVDLFASSMERHFILPVQQIQLPVLTRPGVVENMPYTLVFATRRQDSFTSMNDALCRYRRSIHQGSHRGVLGEEWFEAQYKERVEAERQQLRERLLQLGRAKRVRRWPDLRQQLLVANFGNFLLRDYDKELQELLQSGEVRCEWRRRPTENESQRLPGNDDTLLWSEAKEARKERDVTRGKH